MIGLLLNALKAAGNGILKGVENNITHGNLVQQPQQPAQPYTPVPSPAMASPMDPAAAAPRPSLPQMTALPGPTVQPPAAGAADPNKRRLGAMDVY